MTMEKEVTSVIESITPEMAHEYLKSNKVNRPINEKLVSFYADEMTRGQWKLNGEAICFLKGGALGNGQHRLNAIIKSNMTVDILVVRGCDEDSFTTYDSGKLRSNSDILSLSGIDNAAAISSIIGRYFTLKAQYSSAFSGSITLKYDLKKTKRDFLIEYDSSSALYQDVLHFAKTCYNKFRLLKIAEIAATYVYLIKEKGHDVDTIEKFFRQLFFDEDVDNRAISILRIKLLRDGFSGSKMTPVYRYNLIVKTWNCYITKEEPKMLTWNEARDGRLDFI